MSSEGQRLIAGWRKLAESMGWRVTMTGSGHLRFHPPAGRPITCSSTPSGGVRTIENTRMDLIRAGLPVRRHQHRKAK